MADLDIAYEQLPSPIKDNLTAEQWREARREIVGEGDPVPDTTSYINVKNGQCRQYERGEPADGPLLATHNLSGARGGDSTQFHTQPAGAHFPDPPKHRTADGH